ncbi:hydroxyacylglutathione hydrolase [Psychrobacter sp. I-STPA6b]|uniref:hydroxyacylglutathione hydrolase n=1 Tax=Psychrobacter sp. I-STPA6b TaxID=2585718 RepID=UPI001D0CB8E3|nr:hydroxyacylglutathione hydrolase [Psychrobacter sp. I-STPA6b]
MAIHIRPIKAFKDNYIWTLINDSNNQAIVVDPGQAEPVMAYLEIHDLDLTAIWITHHHMDHTGGVAELQQSYPMTHIVAHSEHGVRMDQSVKDGSSVNAWGYSAQVWEVAGHTQSHLAYLLDIESQKHVFCGDTLFSGGCGRVFTGTIEELYNSFERLKKLPDETLFYPAHEYTADNLRFGLSIEPNNEAIRHSLLEATKNVERGIASLPVTLAHEKQVNVFMRPDMADTIEGVSRQVSLVDTKPLTVFAALRELKNNF